MYRALTWWLLANHVDISSPAAVTADMRRAVIEVGTDPDAPAIRVDGTDVAAAIRTREVSNAVSAVAAVPQVRVHLVAMQRQVIAAAIAAGQGIVAEGRDIGAVVAPEAPVKVFLTASETARASRRSAELAGDPAATVALTQDGLSGPGGLDGPGGLHGLAGGSGDGGQPDGPAPVVAVVGRPNVGKSTLVNRILGSRQAVVEDTPGVTRDRVAYDATWRGRAFTLVDTGGWEPAVEGSPALAARVAAQARVAVDAADAVLFVVDAVIGVTDADAAVATVLRRSRKPVVLAANKVDDAPGEPAAASLWSLGLGEPCPVSALHGRGSGDLLDLILGALPATPMEQFGAVGGPRRVALIGRPNVGKSSLLNTLAGQERAVVDAAAGTTRDPVDELIDLGGSVWRFVDTAGIRRRVRETQGADYFAALRTERALERAEVAVLLVDASQPLAEQDLRIVSMVIESGRALVIAYNKWDLVDADRRNFLDKEIDRQLYTARWAPRVNISAATGWHVDRLVPALERALDGWETRVQTGRLNGWLSGLVAATPPPVRGGRQPKILFATQAGVRPPHFVLFTSGFLQAGYRRFIERRLREEFGFAGSPVQVTMRLREKRAGAGQARRPSSARRS